MEPKRLASYGTIDRLTKAQHLQDVEGQELTLLSAEFRKGSEGEYATIKATNAAGESLTLMTGGYLVVDALKDATAQKAFPLQAKFVKSGRTWTFE